MISIDGCCSHLVLFFFFFFASHGLSTVKSTSHCSLRIDVHLSAIWSNQNTPPPSPKKCAQWILPSTRISYRLAEAFGAASIHPYRKLTSHLCCFWQCYRVPKLTELSTSVLSARTGNCAVSCTMITACKMLPSCFLDIFGNVQSIWRSKGIYYVSCLGGRKIKGAKDAPNLRDFMPNNLTAKGFYRTAFRRKSASFY